jgi:hypothetical protein
MGREKERVEREEGKRVKDKPANQQIRGKTHKVGIRTCFSLPSKFANFLPMEKLVKQVPILFRGALLGIVCNRGGRWRDINRSWNDCLPENKHVQWYADCCEM